MSESIYLIYKHTSPSGKSYIGQTNDYNRRSIEHKNPNNRCAAFSRAIRKYKWENFTHEILIEGLTLCEANELESLLIKQHNTIYPNGYNLVSGGKHNVLSQETRDKMSTNNIMRKDRFASSRVRWTTEARQQHSLLMTTSNNNQKQWKITNLVTSDTIIVTHLKQYCTEHDLNYKSLMARRSLRKPYKNLIIDIL